MTVYTSRIRREYLRRRSLKEMLFATICFTAVIVVMGFTGYQDMVAQEKSAAIDAEIRANAGHVVRSAALAADDTYMETRGEDR